jgi:branched-chain amino acid transport system permease protein
MTANSAAARPTASRQIRLSRGGRIAIGAVVFVGVFWAFIGTQQVANALTLGAIYALIALGYTMVYGIIELINFAHGDIFMVGGFVAMQLLTRIILPVFGLTAPITNPLVLVVILLLTFGLTMPIMGFIGVAIERFAYRPLRNAPRVAPLITAIGVSFILQNIALILFGPASVNSPQLIATDLHLDVLGASVAYVNIFIAVLAVSLMIALSVFVGRTRLGRAMRSTAQDREAAQLMGVDLNLTIAITFFIGSALAGAAGVVWGLYLGSVKWDLGFNGGLKAFTAAVLGGIGNTTGAALGGFVIGFIEVASAAKGYSRWSEAIVFAALIIVLVFRPAGILGHQLGERA